MMWDRPPNRSRAWKRTLLRLTLLLVGGAIINVAVAWGCALRLPDAIHPETTSQSPLQDGTLMVQRRWGDVRVTAHRPGKNMLLDKMREIDKSELHRILPRGSAFQNARWIDDQMTATLTLGGRCFVVEHNHGWPVLAMTGWTNVAYGNGAPSFVQQSGLKEIGPLSLGFCSTATTFRRLIPLQPLWPGFAINTIFYAGILWLLFTAPGFVRRRIRTKRGLCPACAYPVGVGDVCTECGAPVKPRALTTT